MGKIFKAINILLSIILVIIAGAIAYVAIPQFGNRALIVRSGSMEPTIGIGSIVVVRTNQSPQYSKGDVIAFRSESNPNTIITHRVFSVEKKNNTISYRTKGDANKEEDGGIVNQKNILGKSYFVLPGVGQVLSFAKTKLGFSLLIILPALLVIVIEFLNIISHVKKNRKEIESSWDNFDKAQSDGSGFRITGFQVVLLLAFLLGMSIPVAFAFFSDTEKSTGNVFMAAQDFGTVTTSANTKTSNLFVSDGYTCPTGALDTSSFKGTVSITKNGSLDITATLSGVLANTDYQLWVNQDPGVCPLGSPTVPVFITTNGSGNGSNTLNNHGLVGGATNFWVSLVGGTDVLRSTAVSF